MIFFGIENPQQCAEQLGKICSLGFVTDGPNGCYVVQDGSITHVNGFPVNAVDTVGAGDAFAGSVLFGLANDMKATAAARWGNYYASRVVEHIGPRFHGSIKEHLDSVFGE